MTEKKSAFKQACIELNNEFVKKYENIDECNINFSRKCKRKINRVNREIIGDKKAIYPEVDNSFQRLRSKIMHKIKHKT